MAATKKGKAQTVFCGQSVVGQRHSPEQNAVKTPCPSSSRPRRRGSMNPTRLSAYRIRPPRSWACTRPSTGHLRDQLDRPRCDLPAVLALYCHIKNGPDGDPGGDQQDPHTAATAQP